MQEDPRLIYRFFPVEDLRESSPEAHAEHQLSGIQGSLPRQAWTLGLKRNVACHLSRGEVIAHFDDDDLYAADYLERMSHSLLAAERRTHMPTGRQANTRLDERLRPALVTLSEWHILDLHDQAFGFFDPKSDPMVHEDARDSMVLGYGFSYVYTRSAWDLVAFPDVEFSEDGEFAAALLAKGAPVELVRCGPKVCARPGGLAAHTYHHGTTSAGEFAGCVRLGHAVPSPQGFADLLPVVRQVAAAPGIRRAGCHQARLGALAPAMPVAEIGIQMKQDWLCSNAAEGPWPTAMPCSRTGLPRSLVSWS